MLKTKIYDVAGNPCGIDELFHDGDGDCCCCSRSCCICWRPFVSCSICFCVSIYLAWESERACSRADIRSLLIIETGSSGDIKAWGKSEGESSAGKYTECAESESDMDDGLRKTPMVDLTLLRIGPLEILFWCKGDCGTDLVRTSRRS